MTKKVISSLIGCLILLLGLVNIYWFMLRDGFAVIPGDLGDARFVLLLMEHNFQWLTGQVRGSFWSPGWMFYPQPNSFAMSEVMSGAVAPYALLRYVGVTEWLSFH